MTVFVVRGVVLRRALSDSVYGARLRSAETLAEAERVLVEFCRKQGYKVQEVAKRG